MTEWRRSADEFLYEPEQSGPKGRATVHAPARITTDPPLTSLPESVVSAGELGLSYQVLEDWNDD